MKTITRLKGGTNMKKKKTSLFFEELTISQKNILSKTKLLKLSIHSKAMLLIALEEKLRLYKHYLKLKGKNYRFFKSKAADASEIIKKLNYAEIYIKEW